MSKHLNFTWSKPRMRAKCSPRNLGKIKFPRSGKVVEKLFTQRAFDWYHCHLKWTSPSSKFIHSKFDETPEKCRLKSQKSNSSFVFVIRQPNVPGFFLISDRRTYWSGFTSKFLQKWQIDFEPNFIPSPDISHQIQPHSDLRHTSKYRFLKIWLQMIESSHVFCRSKWRGVYTTCPELPQLGLSQWALAFFWHRI